MKNFYNLKPKVNSIYEEYEKIKNQHLSKSNNNKSFNKQNLISNNKINNINDKNKLYMNDTHDNIKEEIMLYIKKI